MPNVTIPDLNDGGVATSVDEFEISRSGVSFRVSLSDMATFTNGLLTAGAPTGFDTFAEVAASLALKQPLDATLTALAGVTFAADKGLYSTGPDAFTTYDLTAAGRALGAVAGTSGTFPYFSASNVVTLASITATGRSIAAAVDGAAVRTLIGAGTGSGTVTSVAGGGTVSGLTLSGTVTGSGSLTLGGTLAVAASNFASQTANTFLSAPNGSAGVPTFRSFAIADLPAMEGLARLQITGSGAPASSGSGVEIIGGASGIIQSGTRTAGILSHNTLSLDGLSVGLRPSGVLNLLSSAGVIGITAASINEAVELDIASGTTTNIATGVANSYRITGTTTITGLGTVTSGVIRRVRFAAALTLTHNAVSLILPTGANITTAAGDTAEFMSLGSGNWVCTRYDRASGAALVSSAGTAADIQTFVANGTWTKPAGSPKLVEVHVFGGGGGGGGGGKAASGTAVSGGGGGGGGAHAVAFFLPSDLSATEAVTVGAGGTSGAGSTVNNTQAGNGGAGGTSNFASKVYAYGGGRGYGGDDAANAGGGGGATIYGAGGDGSTSGGAAGTGAGAGAGSSSANGTAATTFGGGGAGASSAGSSPQGGGQGGPFGGSGGGAGGGVTTAPAASTGGQGRPGPGTDAATVLSGGASGGGAGSAHTPTTTTQLRAGGGGAGGGSSTSTDGGAGGNGQAPGGGGGGGGASISNNGGAGGVGGLGLVVVITTY